jgi:hypothetical protein
MIAKGNVRKILKTMMKVQHLIGKALGNVNNDKSQEAHGDAMRQLEEAFNLCIEQLGKYDIISE